MSLFRRSSKEERWACDRRHSVVTTGLGGWRPLWRPDGGNTGCVTMWRQGDETAQGTRALEDTVVTESALRQTFLVSSSRSPAAGCELPGANTAGRVAVTTAVARSRGSTDLVGAFPDSPPPRPAPAVIHDHQ